MGAAPRLGGTDVHERACEVRLRKDGRRSMPTAWPVPVAMAPPRAFAIGQDSDGLLFIRSEKRRVGQTGLPLEPVFPVSFSVVR